MTSPISAAPITGDSLTPETNAYLKTAPHVLLKPFDLTAFDAALRKILR